MMDMPRLPLGYVLSEGARHLMMAYRGPRVSPGPWWLLGTQCYVSFRLYCLSPVGEGL